MSSSEDHRWRNTVSTLIAKVSVFLASPSKLGGSRIVFLRAVGGWLFFLLGDLIGGAAPDILWKDP